MPIKTQQQRVEHQHRQRELEAARDHHAKKTTTSTTAKRNGWTLSYRRGRYGWIKKGATNEQ